GLKAKEKIEFNGKSGHSSRACFTLDMAVAKCSGDRLVFVTKTRRDAAGGLQERVCGDQTQTKDTASKKFRLTNCTGSDRSNISDTTKLLTAQQKAVFCSSVFFVWIAVWFVG